MHSKYEITSNVPTFLWIIALLFGLAFYFWQSMQEFKTTMEYVKDKAEIKKILENQDKIMENQKNIEQDAHDAQLDCWYFRKNTKSVLDNE